MLDRLNILGLGTEHRLVTARLKGMMPTLAGKVGAKSHTAPAERILQRRQGKGVLYAFTRHEGSMCIQKQHSCLNQESAKESIIL